MIKPLYNVDEMLDGLKQVRDELQLQIHLAAAEAKDEWAEQEEKFEELEHKIKAIGAEAGEASEDVLEALKLVGEEIKSGYDRIRKHL